MNEMRVNRMSDNVCANPAPTNEKVPPLSSLMDEASCLAGDALSGVYRIGQHMFGIDEPKLEEFSEVRCFQDALVNQAVTLKKLNEALACIMSKLGV